MTEVHAVSEAHRESGVRPVANPANFCFGVDVTKLLFVLGVLIVLVTVTSVLFTLVLPRQPAGIERATLVVNRAVRLAFVALSRLTEDYETKDAILAPTAPVALIAQLLFWATTLVIGFALMLMATTHSFPDGLLHSPLRRPRAPSCSELSLDRLEARNSRILVLLSTPSKHMSGRINFSW